MTNSSDVGLSIAMSAYWTSIASEGQPKGNLTWPVYRKLLCFFFFKKKVFEFPRPPHSFKLNIGASSDQSIEFEWPISIQTGLLKSECDLLDKLGYKHGVEKLHRLKHLIKKA